jgi:hypothetical protein
VQPSKKESNITLISTSSRIIKTKITCVTKIKEIQM